MFKKIKLKEPIICFFNSNKAWGGGEKWHFETAKLLNNKNFKVVIFAYSGKELYKRAVKSNIKAIPVKISSISFLNPFKIFRLYRKIKGTGANSIVLNLSADVKAAGLAAKLAGVKNIIYRRGMALPVKNSMINRYIFKYVLTTIVANSNDIKQKLLLNHSYLKKLNKIVVIHNGVNPDIYIQNDKKTKSNNKIILGNVGRLVEQKAQHLLIDLAEQLKNHSIDFEIQIVGSGRLEDPLRNLTREKSLENHIQFPGFVEDLAVFYQDIDIFILTSLHEGTSNALIEAMAWGNPILAFNISSMPEMIQDGQNGFLAEWGDQKKLLENSLKLIQDKNLRDKMGIKSKEIVHEKFNIQTNLQSWIQLLS